jgi:hypothetical protein
MALLPPVPVRARCARAILGLALVAPLAACGGGGAESGGGSTLDLVKPYNNLNLARPSALPLAEGADSGAAVVPGASFRQDLLAESVEAVNTRARFRPNWAAGVPNEARRISAAFYFLDLNGASMTPALLLNWQTAPSTDNLWVGLADFVENRWVWRKLEDVRSVPLPSHSRFQRSADGYMACVLLVLGSEDSILGEITTDQEPAQGFVNADYPLAINLEGLTDWNTSVPYTDLFKTSRAWIPQLVGTSNPWDTGAPVNVDQDGWVTSLDPGAAVMTIMVTDQNGNMPTGRYVCLYEGDGGLNGSAFVISGIGAKVPNSHTPGRFEIDVGTNGNALYLKIEAINPQNYIRNIRVVMPGYEQTHASTNVFNPEFLNSLESFRILRFMDWGKTNNSPITTWSTRPRGTYCRYTTPLGTPIEAMVDLCNKTQKDLWYCIPHQADDDYVTRAVELIRDRLDPGLRLHLEYSNEVWNWIFSQATYAHNQGLLLWPGDNAAWLHWYGLRTAQVMDLASTAFAAETPGRLVRIMATQSQNPGASLESLDQEVTGPSDLAHAHVDVLAVAPYLGGHLGLAANEATTQAMTVTQVLDALEADSIAKNGAGGITEQNFNNAAARGLGLISYEGGQHLVGVGSVVNNQTITDLFIAANRHPRMRQIYFDDMTRWTQRGGGMYTVFTHTYVPNKYGSWGILERISQSRATAYKWLGVHDWLEAVLTD